MAAIKNRHVYQIVQEGVDTKSSKKVVNIFYTRNDAQTGGALVYGDPIAGSSSLATLIANWSTAWKTVILPYLSVNYEMTRTVGNEIVGKQYRTLLRTISSLSATGTSLVLVTAVSPHGLADGDHVQISGVGIPSAVNGVWQIQVYNSSAFLLLGSAAVAGTWSNDGSWRKASGPFNWRFDDHAEFVGDNGQAGSITGDAMPLYVSASNRHITARVGRNWRSKTSMSPLGESQCVDGRLTATALGNISTAWDSYISSPVANGGSDTGSQRQLLVTASGGKASVLTDPFDQSDTWAANMIQLYSQPNLGSVLRRKPRLTPTLP